MVKALTIVAIAAVLAGCMPTGSLCTVGPFIPDKGAGERWTPGEKDQLLVLNRSGAAICGWAKPQ